MSFHQRRGTLPDIQSLKTFYEYHHDYRIKLDSKFTITAKGQLSHIPLVPSFLKNQIFEFEASGKHLENFNMTFTGSDTSGLAIFGVSSNL